MVALLSLVPAASSRATSWICSASSRVGVTMRARATLRGPLSNLCKMGRMNAAVLPVPVCAGPMRSRPRSAAGMAASCMGVAVFDTLTLAVDRLEAFYDNINALHDYFCVISRMVIADEGRNANDSNADCYQ